MKNLLHTQIRLSIVALLLAGVLLLGAAIAAVTLRVTNQFEFALPTATSNQSFEYGAWPALDNVNFYNQVFNTMIAEKATFISANLSTMELQYYQNGVLTNQFKILAKGHVGSWWETPAGLYKVEFKTPKDFSSFAHVYSPWALDFQGNFFIHGWPYYPDGTPVGSTYSGGCIRMSTDDAKTLYDLVSVGTPVLVSSANFDADSFHEATQAPNIQATSYLAADLKSNFVLAEKNANQQLPIGSITKLMTALVAVEYINIEKTITVTPDMIVDTPTPRLKVGQDYSLYDLLQPLLKESSNESAVAISKYLGTPYFVSLMNKTAQSIGMKDTHFVDASGVSAGDVSTTHDLFLLAQYLNANRDFILEMTTSAPASDAAYGPSAFKNLKNVNVFANNPDFIGGKSGVGGASTDSILAVFNSQFTGSSSTPAVGTSTPDTGTVSETPVSRPYVLIVLGGADYETDATTFLSWIQNTYR